MNETCPLGGEKVWDEAIPAACLPCWIAQRNPRVTDIRVTSTGLHDEVGTYHMERGMRRGRQLGRRVITGLMVHDWPGPGRVNSEVVRSIIKDVACLRELDVH